jgi:transcriptional regulator with XRE-family HTH domain
MSLINLPTIVPPPISEPRRLVLHLAQNVAAARRHARLTQQELADAAELSRATVHLVEAGACDPRLSTIAHLARALNRSPLELLEGQDVSRALS